MSDGRCDEVLKTVACRFPKRFEFEHVSEYPETHQECSDCRGSDTSMILEVAARRSDYFLKNEPPKDSRGRWTGQRTDDDIERTYLGSGSAAIAQEYLLYEMSLLISVPLHKMQIWLDRCPQGCGKKPLFRSEAPMHISNIDSSIGRDVAQTGIFIRMSGKSLYRRIQNALLRRNSDGMDGRGPAHDT